MEFPVSAHIGCDSSEYSTSRAYNERFGTSYVSYMWDRNYTNYIRNDQGDFPVYEGADISIGNSNAISLPNNRAVATTENPNYNCKRAAVGRDASVEFKHYEYRNMDFYNPINCKGTFSCFDCVDSCVECTSCNHCYNQRVGCIACTAHCTVNCTTACTTSCTTGCTTNCTTGCTTSFTTGCGLG